MSDLRSLLREGLRVWLSRRWIGLWPWIFLAGLLLITYSGQKEY